MTRQECKHCGAIVGIHAHLGRCPRFQACVICHHDLGKYEKRMKIKYHLYCEIITDGDMTQGLPP